MRASKICYVLLYFYFFIFERSDWWCRKVLECVHITKTHSNTRAHTHTHTRLQPCKRKCSSSVNQRSQWPCSSRGNFFSLFIFMFRKCIFVNYGRIVLPCADDVAYHASALARVHARTHSLFLLHLICCIHTRTSWLNSLTHSLTHRCVEDLAEAQKRISSQEKVDVHILFFAGILSPFSICMYACIYFCVNLNMYDCWYSSLSLLLSYHLCFSHSN